MSRAARAGALARLGAWCERRPRVALMGEFSAGKSTLVNVLVGREVAPTRVTATQAPPLWISHAAEPSAEMRVAGGRSVAIPVERCREVTIEEASLVRLRLPAEGLLRHDVIDTPGLSDPLMAADALDRAVRLADVVLWCTPAMQAWRRSEHAAWTALPERVRRRGVLVVAHADRLTEAERRRVLARLEREAGGLFHDRVLVSATEALRARVGGADDPGLEASGGARLLAAAEAAAVDLRAERRARFERLARAAIEAAPTPPARPSPEPAAPGGASPLRAFEEAAAALPAAPDAGALRSLAEGVIERAGPVTGADGPCWPRLLRAHDFEAADPARLLRQMRGEVADFADGEWREL